MPQKFAIPKRSIKKLLLAQAKMQLGISLLSALVMKQSFAKLNYPLVKRSLKLSRLLKRKPFFNTLPSTTSQAINDSAKSIFINTSYRLILQNIGHQNTISRPNK